MSGSPEYLNFTKNPTPKGAHEGKGIIVSRDFFILKLIKGERKPYRLFYFSPWGVCVCLRIELTAMPLLATIFPIKMLTFTKKLFL